MERVNRLCGRSTRKNYSVNFLKPGGNCVSQTLKHYETAFPYFPDHFTLDQYCPVCEVRIEVLYNLDKNRSSKS